MILTFQLSSNTEEGAGWSRSIPDPSANTSMPGATEDNVFNFIHGQYLTFTRESADRGFELYPMESFGGSLDLQVQQMWGDARYICSAIMIAGISAQYNTAYQYRWVVLNSLKSIF